MTSFKFYSNIKIKLYKIGFIQVFLGFMEMVNILIIYKIILYSINSIQTNQKIINISIGNFYKLEISLFKLLFFAFCYILFKLFISIILTSFKNKALTTLTEDISSEIFISYINMDFSKLNLINTSVLLQNIRGESVFLTRYLSSLTLVFYESVTVLSLVIVLFFIDINLSLFITILLLIIGIVFLLSTKKRLVHWGSLRHKYETKLINQIIETFDGIREVIIYGKRILFTKLFKKVNHEKFNTERKNLNLSELPAFFLEFSFGVSIFSLIVYFAIIENLNYNFETLVVFPLAAYRILPGLNRILSSIQNINFNKKSVKNIKALLDDGFVNYRNTQKNIEFGTIEKIKIENVSFSYDSNNFVFNNLNLEIKTNTILGIHGASGTGKSTFIDLLSGLLTPDSGSIKVNGMNISNNISSYQSLIGYVGQTPYMLQGSLIDNILFEDEFNINENLLLECCIKANIDFVELNLQAMRNFKITDKGTNISGGQRQRIALARALYKKPEILILDEFTSALDNHNEEVLLNSIRKISDRKIIIIVSHKNSTLEICNELLKINKLKQL
jgi:ATP-binding cassette subfamily C protein